MAAVCGQRVVVKTTLLTKFTKSKCIFRFATQKQIKSLSSIPYRRSAHVPIRPLK